MILPIQSGDIEINPGPIQRVIRGSFYQGHQRFGQTPGTQCMCNALYSVGYSVGFYRTTTTLMRIVQVME